MFRSLLLGTLVSASLAIPAAELPNRPVPALDLQRYSGQWHEIAHLPMFFQRKCNDTITATYTPRADGTIGVHNACRTKHGTMETADGIARKVEGEPGALKVRFAPGWLSWLPLVWSDYWVVELDPDYRWAVVGGPSRKYMWVLSRSPSMSADLFHEITSHARQRGYPVDKLVIASPLH